MPLVSVPNTRRNDASGAATISPSPRFAGANYEQRATLTRNDLVSYNCYHRGKKRWSLADGMLGPPVGVIGEHVARSRRSPLALHLSGERRESSNSACDPECTSRRVREQVHATLVSLPWFILSRRSTLLVERHLQFAVAYLINPSLTEIARVPLCSRSTTRVTRVFHPESLLRQTFIFRFIDLSLATRFA